MAGLTEGQNEERLRARRQNHTLVMRFVSCKDWMKAEVELTAFRNTDFVPTFGALFMVWGLLAKLVEQRTPSASYTLFCSNLRAQ